MSSRYPRLTADAARQVSLADRPSKVHLADLAPRPRAGATVVELVDALPPVLAGADFKAVVSLLAGCALRREPLVWALGAHVIKVGLSRLVIELMERGCISALALHGAGAVHDVELALAGKTSEEVGEQLARRDFGMAREACDLINQASVRAGDEELGLGEAIGEALAGASAEHHEVSLLAAGWRLGVPVTVHVAVGTDINHLHPTFDAAAMAAASYFDFGILARTVSDLEERGAIVLVGSAVILPVVIEKAIALARNLGHNVGGFMGVNFDFERRYRSLLNPVRRAAESGGQGYALTGHHEILLPLLTYALLDALDGGC